MSTVAEAAEVVTPEVVEAPSTEVAKQEPPSALERAAEAALAMPGVPGREEFLAMAMQARMLSMSPASKVKDQPHLAFHLAMVGRDLGISPSAALELIDVIPGSGNRPPQLSLSPQLLNGQIRRLGLGSIVPAIQTAERCVAVALRPGGRLDQRCRASWPEHREDCECVGIMGDTEFNWQDAQMAGLVGPECKPGEHKTAQRQRQNGSTYQACPCNQGYITYPKRMMWWRASGYCADDFFPEAGLGLYTAEELGAIVDGEGRPIDAASVELPPGYEPPAPPPQEEADPATIFAIQLGIATLPEDALTVMRGKYTEKFGGTKPGDLSAPQSRAALSILRGCQSLAKANSRGAWTPDAAAEPLLACLAVAASVPLGGFVPQAPDTGPDGDSGAPERPVRRTVPPGQHEPPAANPVPQVPDDALAEDTGAPEEVQEATIARVQAMQASEVDSQLTRLRQHTEGRINLRKRRLVVALLLEHVGKLTGTSPDPGAASAAPDEPEA